MKKILTVLSGILMAAALMIHVPALANVACAQEPIYMVKESQYVVGVYAVDDYGEEVVIALYDNGVQDIAYITNGVVSFYDFYTVTPISVAGASEAERFTVGEIGFTYCEINGGQYIFTDDGDVYYAEYISAYEVEQIRK
ncbi:MAG: hypothetical protein K6G87_05745 [Butyrivibrio sp.]|uniref:hypothetical protein n=1 Tax=Butyrivibrio sp. TaxID=28121 RepID=UPI0025D1A49D|nr:hypothetical protein [Butyrivibrio sp.]MCR5770726.1 hypothetical protein [Butyrivibrio sp.]